MRNKGLIVMGSATLIAVGFALYDLQSEKRAEERKLESSKIVRFMPDQVSQVEILSREITETGRAGGGTVLSNKIRLVRGAEGWRLEEPIQETADQTAARDFVDALATEKSDETLMEGVDIDWKVFGLEEPRGQITVQNNLGERQTIHVSAKKNYQGDAFLRRDQEAKVLLAGADWFAKIEKKAHDFRDKRILRRPLNGVKELIFQSEKGKFTLRQEEGRWVAIERKQWKLDQNKVREYLTLLSNPLITDFDKDGSPSPDETKSWGFTKPRATVQLAFETGDSWKATLARDAEAHNRVWTNEPARVARISAADGARLADLRLDTLRDRKEPFDFKRPDVKRIEIAGRGGKTVLELKKDRWEASEKADGKIVVDHDRVTGFLIKVAGLEVAEFEDGKKAAGSLPRSIRLFGADGALMYELNLGDSFKRKAGGTDRSFVPAKSSLYPEAFLLDDSAVKALNVEEYLEAPKAPPAEGEDKENEEDR